MENINQPSFTYLDDNEKLNRIWKLTAAYQINLSPSLQLMPVLEARSNALSHKGSAMLLATFRDKFMLGAGFQNMDEQSFRGDVAVYASVEIKKHLRLFISYGKNLEWEQDGIDKYEFHSGIRYQF
jgi:hypothetical protein